MPYHDSCGKTKVQRKGIVVYLEVVEHSWILSKIIFFLTKFV